MYFPVIILLILSLAISIEAAPRTALRWSQPPSVTPVAWYGVYKRLYSSNPQWVLVKVLSNTPPRLNWADVNVLPGDSGCYMLKSISAEWVKSVGQSNEVCVVTPE